MPPAKTRCVVFIEGNVLDNLKDLKRRYEECTGIRMKDSSWIAFCLKKGMPIIVGFIQGLEEIRGK